MIQTIKMLLILENIVEYLPEYFGCLELKKMLLICEYIMKYLPDNFLSEKKTLRLTFLFYQRENRLSRGKF